MGRFLIYAAFGILLAACTSVVEKVVPVEGSTEVDSNNYKLSANDNVTISVFQEQDMTTQQQISRDGSVSIPLIGRVVIGGLTMGEAEAKISRTLSTNFLVNPQVSVVVTQYAPQNYTILGQVNAPNAYPIPADEPVFTLPMAIARASGNTRIGNLRNIKINRRHGNAMSQFTVNMLSPEGQQFVIKRGDLITVQETLF